jgi:hypothetical protein
MALLALAVLLTCIATSGARAHPEDEFCVPGEDGLDPALCEALSELDRSADAGQQLKPIVDDEGIERSSWSTVGLYVAIGIRHILPAGLDHILFVLALFLSSTRIRALVIQISTFTVAHTATLGLAAAGVIAPSTSVVEPLIAATIAFVAIENVFMKDMPRWRPVLVFFFGLIHGLGFAGFFGELGLPPGQFWSALIGFNAGVEIGQLSVIACAFGLGLLIRRQLAAHGSDGAWRRYVVVPVSALIGITGLVWTVQRSLP